VRIFKALIEVDNVYERR